MNKSILLFLLLPVLFIGCKKDQEEKKPSMEISDSEIALTHAAGRAELTLIWAYSEWELESATDGFLSDFTVRQGGNLAHAGSTRIQFNYSENTIGEERSQEVVFKNRTTGAEQTVKIIQSPKPPVTLAVNTALKYQNITGFGGMLNPTWTGNVQLNATDMEFLYGSENLGLNMIRMMVYPNANNWDRDVEVALMAQASGARVFASPWTPPAYMKSNNNQTGGYLLPEHYQDYVDHLNAFIAHMASKGVEIEAISIQNEPDIDVSYDGCEWTVEQMHTFVRDYADQINAKVIAAESFNHKFTYTDAILNDPLAANNLDIVGGHLYGARSIIRDYPLARTNGKEVWMTEYLMNDEADNKGLGWDQALAFGEVVHLSMEANFNAFIWWYLKRFYSLIGDGEEGTTSGARMHRAFVLGHYAKYATGRQRVGIDKIAGNNDFLLTAYEGEYDITLILQNNAATDLGVVQFDLPIEVSGVEAVESTETSEMATKTVALTADKTALVVSVGAKSIISIKLIK